VIDILKQIAEICFNKYVGFYCGVLIFLMPAIYRIRLFFETKRNTKLRSIALSQLCNAEPFWEPDEIPELSEINASIKPFEFINVVSQALFDIKLFENNEPIAGIGFKDCIMIPMFSLNHFVELYNKSLFSGFWSLFFKPVALLDDKSSKIHVFKKNDDENKRMIIVIKFDNDYVKIFKFTNMDEK
jgi:hypothetical protein